MSGSRGFVVLAVVTLIFWALAMSTHGERAVGVGALSESREAWWPGLFERVNEVAHLRVRGADGAVDVHRDGDRWVVEQLDGYPADADVAKRLVMGLARATRVQARTALLERQPLLGLEWPPSAGVVDASSAAAAPDLGAAPSEALEVTLSDARGTELARVVLGRAEAAGPRRQRLNARRADEAQCWLVDAVERPSTAPLDWIDRVILDLPEERVRRLRLQAVEGEPVVIERTDEQAREETGRDWELIGVPEGREVAAFTQLGSAARALAGVRVDGVRSGPAPADLTWTHVRFETTDGLVLELRVARVGDEAVLELRAEAGAEADESARADVERWTALWSQRHFSVPPWFRDRLDQSLEDFLTPAPETDAALPTPGQPVDAVPGTEAESEG